jgi:hypothetical protein
VVLCADVCALLGANETPCSCINRGRTKGQGAKGGWGIPPHIPHLHRGGAQTPCPKEGGQSTPCPAHGKQGGAKMGPAVGEKGGVDSKVILLSTPPFLLGHWWGRRWWQR